MKYIDEIKSVDMSDIANMILLAEGVLIAEMDQYPLYDEDGVRLKGDDLRKQWEKYRADETEELVMSIICSEETTLSDAIWITVEELTEKLAPIRSRVLSLFRNGVNCDAAYYEMRADPSVPDEWLFALFAMRVRDRMISAAIVREHDKKKEKA